MQEFLSLGEAAQLVGRSRETIRRWTHEGRIPYKRNRLGYRIFLKSDVLAQLERLPKWE